MAEKIGSPQLDDWMAQFERITTSAMKQFEKFVDEHPPPRDFGSERQSNEEMLPDFEAVGGDPELLTQRAAEHIARRGPTWGWDDFVKWYAKMLKLREERGGGA